MRPVLLFVFLPPWFMGALIWALAWTLAWTLAFDARAAEAELVGGCVPCHGLDGIGRDAEIPNLAGQKELYLYNQLKAFRAGRRSQKEMQFMSSHMTDDEMKSLAAYFASLPPR